MKKAIPFLLVPFLVTVFGHAASRQRPVEGFVSYIAYSSELKMATVNLRGGPTSRLSHTCSPSPRANYNFYTKVTPAHKPLFDLLRTAARAKDRVRVELKCVEGRGMITSVAWSRGSK